MSWRKNTRFLSLMLAFLVVASIVPGFLIPVKAQGQYNVTLVDPEDGVLYVNQSHTVVLNVTENGTAVAGLNVTLSWNLNNTLVAVWNTTNATGFVTFQD
ncbi:MAG: hypothetical protein J7K57_07975, partial [Palaeococcus sp.]|uniref:hypothetical protein n=1 Tax=Palaeococcus sp. (in: euryarchaeotes) TaxID=2820298 RepID=UPI0025FD1BBC